MDQVQQWKTRPRTHAGDLSESSVAEALGRSKDWAGQVDWLKKASGLEAASQDDGRRLKKDLAAAAMTWPPENELPQRAMRSASTSAWRRATAIAIFQS